MRRWEHWHGRKNEWLMVVSSLQVEFDPKSLMNGKGGQQVRADNKKTEGDEVGAGKKDLDSYCS